MEVERKQSGESVLDQELKISNTRSLMDSE